MKIVFPFGIVHFFFEKIIIIDKVLINAFHRISIVAIANDLLEREDNNIKIQAYFTAFLMIALYVFWGMSLLLFVNW
ncbi:hypothetical protein [Fibrella aquatilis]|uniref:Uncharacterized protein n=1 Tax=Fibrella aquatilis TaxID=2817059 RepID=A0A939G9U7_9BACT|nr:hypothetical protein [Fibrella aquatilis]MBO0933314.1 hypothetical protein [Fibrella aquatilis]